MNQAAPAKGARAAPLGRKRRGWRFLALLCLGFTAAGGALFCIWFWSDADLVRLRAELAGKGVATTWPELRLKRSDAAVLETWRRLPPLAQRLKSYERSRTTASSAAQLGPFLPVPEAARLHHAKLDHEDLATLRDCIERLGDGTLVTRSPSDRGYVRPDTSTIRDLRALLEEDALLAEPTDVATCCRRMLRFCAVQPIESGLGYAVKSSSAVQSFRIIAARLDELRRADPAIADAVEALADRLLAELPAAMAVVVVERWSTWADRANGRAVPVTGTLWFDRMLSPVLVRSARAEYLRHFSSVLEALDAHATPSAVLDICEDRVLEERRSMDNSRSPIAYMRAIELLSPPEIILYSYRTSLYGRLLAAQLRGQPWPEDWQDPAHGRLRALVRDGRVVGAYSLGADGVDHAGVKPNHYFPLLEWLVP